MGKIFVSCGQYTEAEKSLGKEIVKMIRAITGLEAFFADVTAALPKLLQQWRSLLPSGVRVQLQSIGVANEQGHFIRQLSVNLINDRAERITSFSCKLRLPTGLLKHWSSGYAVPEEKSDDPRYRCFRFDETFKNRTIQPRATEVLIQFNYCTQCAMEYTGDNPTIAGLLVAESVVEATVWLDRREYSAAKTIKELRD